VEPAEPIRADAQSRVVARFEADEAPADAALPEIGYRLSGPGRPPVSIASVQPLGERRWQAEFDLPGDAGAAGPETLSFTFAARDDLDNISPEIEVPNAFQVY